MSSPSFTWSEEAVVGVDSSPIASASARASSARASSVRSSSVTSDCDDHSYAHSASGVESPPDFRAANKVKLASANDEVGTDDAASNEAADNEAANNGSIVSSATSQKDVEISETQTAPATTSASEARRSVSWADSVNNAAAADADVDPQSVYPSTACVFVANLAEPRDDVALEAAVTRTFSRFGTVFVKIRRDLNNLPFAFAQYTNEQEAKEAIEKGRGLPILGRPCRTEMVKSNRSFIIFKRDASEILIDEARKIMETFGTVSSIEVVSEATCERMDLPSAVLVEYSSFSQEQPLNKATALFPEHVIDMFDSRKRTLNPVDRNAEFLRQYDIDRKSIYVGDIPLDATEHEMFELFSDIGEVIKVNLVQRHTQDGSLARQFCFVEFDRATRVDEAIAALDGAIIRGWNIKVQRKQSKVAKSPFGNKYAGRLEPAEKSTPGGSRDTHAAPRPGNFTGQIFDGPNGTLSTLQASNQTEYIRAHQGQQGPAHQNESFQRYAGPPMPPMPYIPSHGTAVGISGMPVHSPVVSPSFGHTYPVYPPSYTPPGIMSSWPVITNTPTRQHQAMGMTAATQYNGMNHAAQQHYEMGPAAQYHGMGQAAQYNQASGYASAQMGAPPSYHMAGGRGGRGGRGGYVSGRAHHRRARGRHFFQPADADIDEE